MNRDLVEKWVNAEIVDQRCTAKNTPISPNFLVRKFCGKAQLSHSFGRIAQHYAETVPLMRIFGEIMVFFAEVFYKKGVLKNFEKLIFIKNFTSMLS